MNPSLEFLYFFTYIANKNINEFKHWHADLTKKLNLSHFSSHIQKKQSKSI
jgi:hypothetical protein